jgi:hypothetical protein
MLKATAKHTTTAQLHNNRPSLLLRAAGLPVGLLMCQDSQHQPTVLLPTGMPQARLH